jgi:hypothetical protein
MSSLKVRAESAIGDKSIARGREHTVASCGSSRRGFLKYEADYREELAK